MTPNSAVRFLSARVSAAVNPANIATFPIGSIVVQRVAKSLLILIRSGDIFSVCGNHRQPCNLSSAFFLSRPLRRLLGIKERAIDLLSCGTEHTVNLDSVRHSFPSFRRAQASLQSESWAH